MATLHEEEFGFGFTLELRDTALIEQPFAVEFSNSNTLTLSNYFSTYEEALQFFDYKALEIHQALDCFLKREYFEDAL